VSFGDDRQTSVDRRSGVKRQSSVDRKNGVKRNVSRKNGVNRNVSRKNGVNRNVSRRCVGSRSVSRRKYVGSWRSGAMSQAANRREGTDFKTSYCERGVGNLHDRRSNNLTAESWGRVYI